MTLGSTHSISVELTLQMGRHRFTETRCGFRYRGSERIQVRRDADDERPKVPERTILRMVTHESIGERDRLASPPPQSYPDDSSEKTSNTHARFPLDHRAAINPRRAVN